MATKWVIFDVGETLVSERRLFDEWADWLGVPRDEFWAQLREVISDRLDHRAVFEQLRPGFDLATERKARAEAGRPDQIELGDLYDDALPTIHALSTRGLKVGVAGNQPASTTPFIEALGAPVELIGMSDDWHVKKPSPEFFQKLVDLTGVATNEVAYVGDRLDNDVLPAQGAGMTGVFLARGPWGEVHANWLEAADADHIILGLSELPGIF